jgi:hypothetical protein
MRFALVLAMVGVAVVAEAQQKPAAQAVVDSYLQIHSALAGDTLDGVPAAVEALVAQAKAMGGPAGGQAVKAARAVAAAKDVKVAREAFKPLSDAVIAIVRQDPKGHEVKLAYCPMADASWLQKDEQIKNPYYGSSMLTCGEFRPIVK